MADLRSVTYGSASFTMPAIVVDDALDTTSQNALQNSVIASAFNTLTSNVSGLDTRTSALETQLSGVESILNQLNNGTNP